LEYYIDLFIFAIAESRKVKTQRVDDIINTHQLTLYDSICRALLEKDKLIFSFLMCIKILESEGIIKPSETRFLMVGGTWTESDKP
jgi:dynein heavy chain, axonemal